MQMWRTKSDVNACGFDAPIGRLGIYVGRSVERLKEIITAGRKPARMRDTIDLANLVLETLNGCGCCDCFRRTGANILLTGTDQCFIVASKGSEFLLQKVKFVLNV
jgi:hypothetical protein